MTVSGFAAEAYQPVRVAFAKLIADGRETGAGLSIWANGREVVQLNGGWSDAARRRPWASDTLVHTYSTSKPFAALAALTAVAEGALGLDEPIAKYWTDYAAKGKGDTTLRHILTHRAGLPAFPAPAGTLDILDDAGLRACLASAMPETAPGSTVAEHALTYGHLIDGVLRAATGRSLKEMFTEVVRPALELDGWFGVPDAELHRVAELEFGLASEDFVDKLYPTYRRVLAVPKGSVDLSRLNSSPWRQAAFGAINLHSSAAALARFYAHLTSAEGPVRRLLGQELHTDYLHTQVCGHDETVGTTVNWTLGFLRTDSFIGLGGLGGSAAYWSFRPGHAVAYVTRRLHDHARVGEIAALLGDDLNTTVSCG
ncbi:MAG: serine hydrolase domain-containing protein [Parvibaculaceae bacterium]